MNYTKEELRAARIEMKLTQRDLANLANISVHTIENLEQGKRSGDTETWNKIEQALNADKKGLNARQIAEIMSFEDFLLNEYAKLTFSHELTSNEATHEQMQSFWNSDISMNVANYKASVASKLSDKQIYNNLLNAFNGSKENFHEWSGEFILYSEIWFSKNCAQLAKQGLAFCAFMTLKSRDSYTQKEFEELLNELEEDNNLYIWNGCSKSDADHELNKL